MHSSMFVTFLYPYTHSLQRQIDDDEARSGILKDDLYEHDDADDVDELERVNEEDEIQPLDVTKPKPAPPVRSRSRSRGISAITQTTPDSAQFRLLAAQVESLKEELRIMVNMNVFGCVCYC
mgnify:CR=1 FL=1